MEFTGSSPAHPKLSPTNPFTGQISAGVEAQKLQISDPTRCDLSDPLLCSYELKSPSVPGGVAAPVTDQWSTKTPEKPIPNRIARSLLSLKDVREAARKLRKPGPAKPEISDPLLCSGELKSPSVSVSASPASERKKLVNSVNLPEKYEMLEKFFNSMDSSIRLLQLKGSATTFTNISAKVECLMDKRFTYSHLAQMKFILPEAIEIKKILKYDERTCCMKPDLYVTLNANAVDSSEKWKSNSNSVLLRKVFHSRLLNFFKFHPGGDDIPEELLPGPFVQSKQAANDSSGPSGSSLTTEAPNGVFPMQSVAASHLSASFRRCFSSRASISGGTDAKEEDRVGLVTISPASVPLKDTSSTKKKTVRCADSPISLKQTSGMKYSSGGIVLASSPSCHPPAPPMIEAKKGEDGSTSAPATPMLEPPKRCYVSPDDDPAEPPIKLARHSSTRRSLFFDTPVKSANATDQVCESGRFSTDDDTLDILHENLLQSIGEKENEAVVEQNPSISQEKRRKQMIARLPHLFDMIYFLFQSIKRSVMTKEELMHRVISSHLEITDKSEVEEQLILLQELAPEWIYEKPASGGTLLLVVNKITSPDTIRSRLAGAKCERKKIVIDTIFYQVSEGITM